MQNYDLNTPILEFGEHPNYAVFKLKHAFESILITGCTGAGKTSSSGRTLALKYLANGFSGLVLTAKNDEADNWREYCRITGRSDDLVIISPDDGNYFNWLKWESTVSADNRALTDNVVQCLKTVIAAAKERETGNKDDEFWVASRDMLMYHSADLCQLAYGTITVKLLYDIVQSVPRQNDERSLDGKSLPDEPVKAFDLAYKLARAKVERIHQQWGDAMPSKQKLDLTNDGQFEAAAEDEIPEYRLLKHVHEFFFGTFKELHDKTKNIVLVSFSGFLFRLMRDPIYRLFCLNESNVTPNDMFEGKIIVLDIPIKRYHGVARDAQTMVKYIFQRALEARKVDANTRPCFIYADEAMNFITEYDADFLSTARSARVSTVYLAQNIDQFFAAMGGENSRHRVLSLLGNFGCKIFHANSSTATNQYASELIGDAVFENPSSHVSFGKDFSMGESTGLTVMKLIRPENFISLNTGGPENEYQVSAYIHRQGDPIFFGRNHIKVCFDQKFKP